MSSARNSTARGCASRIGGCVVGLVAIAVMIVGFWGFTRVVDMLLVAPWGYPLLGRPTLAGHWVSTFTTPSGIRFALYLEIARALDEGGGTLSDENHGTELISGRAHWCDDRGRHLENMPVQGSVPSYSGYDGSAERVVILIETGKSPPVGLLPSHFEGQWRTDTLRLKPDFSFWTGSAFQSSSSNPDQTQPMTVVLHKGEVAEFRAACARWDSA